MIPGFSCPRRIGFLFPHPCTRLSSVGCPDCQNGAIDDPYRDRTDRDSYSDFDSYDGVNYDGMGISPSADFNEADGEYLVRPEAEEFEDDLTES